MPNLPKTSGQSPAVEEVEGKRLKRDYLDGKGLGLIPWNFLSVYHLWNPYISLLHERNKEREIKV